jgi:hypothetical protein
MKWCTSTNNGRSYVTELPSSYDSTAHPLSPWGWDGNGTYECGPWELDDTLFAERTASKDQPLGSSLLQEISKLVFDCPSINRERRSHWIASVTEFPLPFAHSG